MTQTLKILRLSPEEEAEINYEDIPKMKPGMKLVRTSLEEMREDWEGWRADSKTHGTDS